MFMAFKCLEVNWVATQTDLAHVVYLVALGDVPVVHPVDGAVEHLSEPVAATCVAPDLA
jgi:hypothetical protein